MERAVWKNSEITAIDISGDYSLEKEIRKASANKELMCPDDGCSNPCLRYCHGDKKAPYFTHLINADCDYALFDKNDPTFFKEIRKKLYSHFSALGLSIKLEVKLFEHHYTHMVLEKDGIKFAIELGSSKTTVKYYEHLKSEYEKLGLQLKWIIVGEQTDVCDEKQVFFLKRALLNETSNHEFILIDENCETVGQYRWHPDPRAYNKTINFFITPDIFIKHASVESLSIENGELVLTDYNNEYSEWLAGKNQEAAEKERERSSYTARPQITINHEHNISQKAKQETKPNNHVGIVQSRTQEKDQPAFVRDRGYYTCKYCKQTKSESEFVMYDMATKMGTCRDCLRSGALSKPD